MASSTPMIDPDYPGTAVERMLAARDRVASLTKEDLNNEWEEVRRKILWAGGLRDLTKARPGQGYTGHSFNDYNHVDLTCMLDKVSDNENDGSVKRIAIGNHLGPGIRAASLPELGSGGSWSTCAIGCSQDPPQDVAHIQFRSRIGKYVLMNFLLGYCSSRKEVLIRCESFISMKHLTKIPNRHLDHRTPLCTAFKLVWCPTESFDTFVLVDDDGKELAQGKPTGRLPSLRERQVNYKIVAGSKYAFAADNIAKQQTTSTKTL